MCIIMTNLIKFSGVQAHTTPILGVQFRTALFNRTVAQTVPMNRMTVMLSYRYVCHTSVTLALCMSKFLSVMEEMRAASFKVRS